MNHIQKMTTFIHFIHKWKINKYKNQLDLGLFCYFQQKALEKILFETKIIDIDYRIECMR